MVEKQPKALRLADELLALYGPTDIDERAAAELRRLYDENRRLANTLNHIAEARSLLVEEKNYLLHKAGENLAEIAELRDNLKRLTLAMQESDAENAELKKQNLELLSIILDSFKVLGDKK